MLFFHHSLTQQNGISLAHMYVQKQGNIWSQEGKRSYFAGSLLLADLALLISLVPLLLFKPADELRAMLLNQTHLDGPMVSLRMLQPSIISLYHLRQSYTLSRNAAMKVDTVECSPH